MKKTLKDLLYFTQTERQGVIFLVLLISAIYIFPFMYKSERFQAVDDEKLAQLSFVNFQSKEETKPAELHPFNPDTTGFQSFLQFGLSEKIANRILNYRDHGGHFDNDADFRKIYGLAQADFDRLQPFLRFSKVTRPSERVGKTMEKKDTLFPFDPNGIAYEGLLDLGVPEKTAAIWMKFLKSGGTFRTEEDVKKIYGMTEPLYIRLKPWVKIPPNEGLKPMNYSSGPGFSKKKQPMVPVDINKSTVEDWKTLPGIGQTRAERIIAFREKLGGFCFTDQVGETRGLPDSVFQEIKPFLTSSPIFKKLHLNTCSAQEFSDHPYFSPRQAAVLVAYRNNHGPFAAVGEIRKVIPLNDEKWLEKIMPYLEL